VGIETLIIFIAMILVAAVAAGVLINTAGFLQNKASSTSQDSEDQVSNQVIVISATGTVNATAPDGAALATNNVNETTLTVMKSPGADEIDLGAATVEWVGPDGTTTLVYNSTGTPASGNATFNVTSIKDDGGSQPVLTSKEDRFEIQLNHTGNSSDVLNPLYGGDEVTLRLVTQSGSQYVYILDVPESLSAKSDGEAVEM